MKRFWVDFLRFFKHHHWWLLFHQLELWLWGIRGNHSLKPWSQEELRWITGWGRDVVDELLLRSWLQFNQRCIRRFYDLHSLKLELRRAWRIVFNSLHLLHFEFWWLWWLHRFRYLLQLNMWGVRRLISLNSLKPEDWWLLRWKTFLLDLVKFERRR